MNKRSLLLLTLMLIFTQQAAYALAEWTVLTYIQGDNDLDPFADFNIRDMQKVGSTPAVNIVVQWDQPNNNKTWRYKVNKGSRTDVGTLNLEMGVNAKNELVSAMQWVKDNYPAKKYALILWDHGNGVLDRALNKALSTHSWLATIPGGKALLQERGILYDYTQDTFLDNSDLLYVLQQTKNILGQNLDILGTDACYMGMLELACQAKDYANYFVASEETIPGEGWPYSRFLAPLVKTPTQTALTLSKSIVSAYKSYYRTTRDVTLSSVDVSKVAAINTTLNAVIQEINTIAQTNGAAIRTVINRAYTNATHFSQYDYIDLYTFLSNLSSEAKKNKAVGTKSFTTALTNAMNATLNAVVANGVGTAYPKAKGISIYFPSSLPLGDGYTDTLFYQQSQWASFLNNYA
ncbi:hypothetical protein K2X40_01300 [Candidatus Babeliales bacterium]|nr:hypothetical protein [Candidatus Babeliales bacterium]